MCSLSKKQWTAHDGDPTLYRITYMMTIHYISSEFVCNDNVIIESADVARRSLSSREKCSSFIHILRLYNIMIPGQPGRERGQTKLAQYNIQYYTEFCGLSLLLFCRLTIIYVFDTGHTTNKHILCDRQIIERSVLMRSLLINYKMCAIDIL